MSSATHCSSAETGGSPAPRTSGVPTLATWGTTWASSIWRSRLRRRSPGSASPRSTRPLDANGTAGLAQQISLLAAAELPTSASCDAQTCAPMTPPEVITGNTGYDRDIGFFEALTGNARNSNGQPFALFSNWLQVPLSDLTSGLHLHPRQRPGPDRPQPRRRP